MTMIQAKIFLPKYKKVIEKYEGHCPECESELVFAEASFYCPLCGFCENDFEMECPRPF